MPRTAPPAVRAALIETAATMLAHREPVTLRALAARSGTTTMAVYTHFDGMAGLWRAVRQEGFVRLAGRLDRLPPSDDPVADLAGLAHCYQAAALDAPDLYRVMFDAAADLDDPAVADRAFDRLVGAAGRARDAGRFTGDADPRGLATQLWAAGHGLATLVLGRVLPPSAAPALARDLTVAVAMAAGDDPQRCRRSVAAGWDAAG